MSEHQLRVEELYVHPVKSCAGFATGEVRLIETGFELDREWMVVDASGTFVSQRDLPRMALVRTAWRAGEVVLRAPGMLALHLRDDTVEGDCRVRVWDDQIPAFDMGDLAAQWFSDFFGRPLRLARFDPDVRRVASAKWTGERVALTAFADAFPLLVVSTASLAELNRRLAAAHLPRAAMNRFRPNVVIDGLDDAHGEDHIDTLAIESPDGNVVLKLVKPCGRCTIPDVDPDTAEQGHAIADTLSTYRAEPRIGGALAFGQNAVIVEGVGCRVRRGASVRARLNF